MRIVYNIHYSHKEFGEISHKCPKSTTDISRKSYKKTQPGLVDFKKKT